MNFLKYSLGKNSIKQTSKYRSSRTRDDASGNIRNLPRDVSLRIYRNGPDTFERQCTRFSVEGTCHARDRTPGLHSRQCTGGASRLFCARCYHGTRPRRFTSVLLPSLRHTSFYEYAAWYVAAGFSPARWNFRYFHKEAPNRVVPRTSPSLEKPGWKTLRMHYPYNIPSRLARSLSFRSIRSPRLSERIAGDNAMS